MSNPVLLTALEALDAGCSLTPIKPDGSKEPPGPWKHLQTTAPTVEQVHWWFAEDPDYGLAVLGGKVSANLEWVDFDDREVMAAAVETATELGLGDLVERIRSGYEEYSPDGAHWAIRCAEISGNTPLARRPNPDDPRKPQVLIEIRGEGGYAIVAPSNGAVHPSGKPYELISGSFATIVTITPEERAALFRLLRSFDEMPPEEAPPPRGATGPTGNRPGDAFRAANGDLEGWRAILEPHGWVLVYQRGEVGYWRRPGKDQGVSATTGHAGTDYLYVFSTSTIFPTERGINPFSAYATLNHGGDYQAAAQALAAEGYGTSTESGNDAASSLERQPFPTDCLPQELQILADEAEQTLGVPAAYIATVGLSVIGSVIGDRLQVMLKRNWTERALLFCAIVGDPGTAKTPAIALATQPLSDIQRDLYLNWQAALDIWEDTPKGERGQRPEMVVCKTTDSTIEGVARYLNISPMMLAEFDELTSWLTGHNRYRGQNASERGQWLSIWAGVQLVVTRSGKDPLVIDKPAVSVTGGIQPDRLRAIAGDDRGSTPHDGMFDRFFFAWPDAEPAEDTDDEMSETTLSNWGELVNDVRKWRPAETPYTITRGPRIVTIRLSDKARLLWKGWHRENNRSIESSEGLTRGWAAKAPTHLLRLALVLHAASNADNPDRDIEPETLEAAITILEWYREQHGLVLEAIGAGTASQPAGLSARVERLIRNAPADVDDGWIDRTRLHRKLGNSVKAEQLDAVLEELLASGAIIERAVQTGARPRQLYAHTCRTYENMKYSTPEPEPPHSGNVHTFISSDDVGAKKQRSSPTRKVACQACGSPRTVAFPCPHCGRTDSQAKAYRKEMDDAI